MKTYINMTEEAADFSLSLSDFGNLAGETLELNDIVTIVFTMVSENGETVDKEMSLSNIRFSNNIVLANRPFGIDMVETLAYPNPMTIETTIKFASEKAEEIEVAVYNQLGALVRQSTIAVTQGNNKFTINRMGLHTGTYFVKLRGENTWFSPIKLIINDE